MTPPLPVNLYDVVKHWLWIKKPEFNPWGKPVPPAIYTESLLNGIETLVESLPDNEHLADLRTLAGRYDRHSLWVAEEMQLAVVSRDKPSANPDKWRDIIDPAEHGVWRPYRIAKEPIEWVEIVEPTAQGYVRNVSPLEIWRTVFDHAQEIDTVKMVGAENPFKIILSITACEPDSVIRACKTALRLFVQPEFNNEVRALRENDSKITNSMEQCKYPDCTEKFTPKGKRAYCAIHKTPGARVKTKRVLDERKEAEELAAEYKKNRLKNYVTM